MDNIFPSGLIVGKVISLRDELNTKIAIIKPKENVLSIKYFYILKK
jgi:cell shape-determining protein MreC